MGSVRRAELTGLRMIVLSWLTFHPDHGPEDIAQGLRAEDDVDDMLRG